LTIQQTLLLRADQVIE